MIQRDYIMRQIEMLAKIVMRLLKLKEQKEYDLAIKEIGNGYDELFAAEAKLLKIVDTTTAAQFLGHWERVKIFATLCEQEADIHALQGNESMALAKYQKAVELFEKALQIKGKEDMDCANALESVREEIGRIAGQL